jgi:hypothetical protein
MASPLTTLFARFGARFGARSGERSRHRERRERGSATLWLVVGMVPMVGFAAVAIDVGTVVVARAKVQRAAESAAHAGVKALRDGQGDGGALARAQQVFDANTSGGSFASDASVGSFDLASGAFSDGGTVGPGEVPAVELQAEGSVPLVFAPIVGVNSMSFSVEAVYGGRKREVVIVQDVSGSFNAQLQNAKNADMALVQQMADQDLPGDRVGVVTFGSSTAVERDLSPLATETPQVLGTIAAIQQQTCGANPRCGNSTRTDLGIQQATDLFQFSDPAETERVIIIVTDGQPTGVGNAQLQAENAADVAGAQGIHIFTLLLNTNNNPQASFSNQQLTRGAGTAFETADPASLEELLLQILGALPLLLVR